MPNEMLYHRALPYGPAVRIRRTSAHGATPVIAVLEVDRRAGTPRSAIGNPPPLMQCEGATESEVLAILEAHARDDRTIVQLLHEKGLH
jgi:hypothetical protein